MGEKVPSNEVEALAVEDVRVTNGIDLQHILQLPDPLFIGTLRLIIRLESTSDVFFDCIEEISRIVGHIV